MKVVNVFFKILNAYKASLTMFTIEVFIEHGFNMSPLPILPAKCGIENASFKTFLLDWKFLCFCIIA